MKALIDTNVIVDALTSREPWKESAEKIFLMAANCVMDMYITASSATDIYYLVRKYLHSTEQAKQVMGKLYSFMGILAVTSDECVDALASGVDDYEDAVIERTAVKAGIDYIITRNVKDYQEGRVKAILPDDFIALMEEEE
ncbi:MAG: PIN domain-containing protein [Lachnospiraceae bacterium]|nr:PIN domain-containing protein [Lachnospiraceae bacterium]